MSFLTSLILFRQCWLDRKVVQYNGQGRDSGGRVWVQVPTLARINFMSFMPQFPHLENGVNHKVYLMGLLWQFTELLYLKHVEECVTHGSYNEKCLLMLYTCSPLLNLSYKNQYIKTKRFHPSCYVLVASYNHSCYYRHEKKRTVD